MVIKYGCCVGSEEKLEKNILTRVEPENLIVRRHQTSIAEAYNTVLARCQYTEEIDAVVLLHDDLEIIDEQFETKILKALADPTVAIVGVIGAEQMPRNLAWWNFNIIGHQRTDSMMIQGSQSEGDAWCTDGSIMALSPWAVNNLEFDQDFVGFHHYDVDIGLQARQAGKRVMVADIDTFHHTQVGFKSPEIEQSWHQADRIFRRKWFNEH